MIDIDYDPEELDALGLPKPQHLSFDEDTKPLSQLQRPTSPLQPHPDESLLFGQEHIDEVNQYFEDELEEDYGDNPDTFKSVGNLQPPAFVSHPGNDNTNFSVVMEVTKSDISEARMESSLQGEVLPNKFLEIKKEELSDDKMKLNVGFYHKTRGGRNTFGAISPDAMVRVTKGVGKRLQLRVEITPYQQQLIRQEHSGSDMGVPFVWDNLRVKLEEVNNETGEVLSEKTCELDMLELLTYEDSKSLDAEAGQPLKAPKSPYEITGPFIAQCELKLFHLSKTLRFKVEYMLKSVVLMGYSLLFYTHDSGKSKKVAFGVPQAVNGTLSPNRSETSTKDKRSADQRQPPTDHQQQRSIDQQYSPAAEHQPSFDFIPNVTELKPVKPEAYMHEFKSLVVDDPWRPSLGPSPSSSTHPTGVTYPGALPPQHLHSSMDSAASPSYSDFDEFSASSENGHLLPQDLLLSSHHDGNIHHHHQQHQPNIHHGGVHSSMATSVSSPSESSDDVTTNSSMSHSSAHHPNHHGLMSQYNMMSQLQQQNLLTSHLQQFGGYHQYNNNVGHAQQQQMSYQQQMSHQQQQLSHQEQQMSHQQHAWSNNTSQFEHAVYHNNQQVPSLVHDKNGSSMSLQQASQFGTTGTVQSSDLMQSNGLLQSNDLMDDGGGLEGSSSSSNSAGLDAHMLDMESYNRDMGGDHLEAIMREGSYSSSSSLTTSSSLTSSVPNSIPTTANSVSSSLSSDDGSTHMKKNAARRARRSGKAVRKLSAGSNTAPSFAEPTDEQIENQLSGRGSNKRKRKTDQITTVPVSTEYPYTCAGSLDVQGVVRAQSFVQFSDIRFKTNVEDITDALNIVTQLHGKKYEWKDSINGKSPASSLSGGRKVIGLIAQEVKRVIPEVVVTDSNGYLSLNYTDMVPLLIEALKQHVTNSVADNSLIKEEISELRAKVDELSQRSGDSTCTDTSSYLDFSEDESLDGSFQDEDWDLNDPQSMLQFQRTSSPSLRSSRTGSPSTSLLSSSPTMLRRNGSSSSLSASSDSTASLRASGNNSRSISRGNNSNATSSNPGKLSVGDKPIQRRSSRSGPNLISVPFLTLITCMTHRKIVPATGQNSSVAVLNASQSIPVSHGSSSQHPPKKSDSFPFKFNKSKDHQSSSAATATSPNGPSWSYETSGVVLSPSLPSFASAMAPQQPSSSNTTSTTPPGSKKDKEGKDGKEGKEGKEKMDSGMTGGNKRTATQRMSRSFISLLHHIQTSTSNLVNGAVGGLTKSSSSSSSTQTNDGTVSPIQASSPSSFDDPSPLESQSLKQHESLKHHEPSKQHHELSKFQESSKHESFSGRSSTSPPSAGNPMSRSPSSSNNSSSIVSTSPTSSFPLAPSGQNLQQQQQQVFNGTVLPLNSVNPLSLAASTSDVRAQVLSPGFTRSQSATPKPQRQVHRAVVLTASAWHLWANSDEEKMFLDDSEARNSLVMTSKAVTQIESSFPECDIIHTLSIDMRGTVQVTVDDIIMDLQKRKVHKDSSKVDESTTESSSSASSNSTNTNNTHTTLSGTTVKKETHVTSSENVSFKKNDSSTMDSSDSFQTQLEQADLVWFIGHSQGAQVCVHVCERLLRSGVLSASEQLISVLSLGGLHHHCSHALMSLHGNPTVHAGLHNFGNNRRTFKEYKQALGKMLELGVTMTTVAAYQDALINISLSSLDYVSHPNILRSLLVHHEYKGQFDPRHAFKKASNFTQEMMRFGFEMKNKNRPVDLLPFLNIHDNNNDVQETTSWISHARTFPRDKLHQLLFASHQEFPATVPGFYYALGATLSMFNTRAFRFHKSTRQLREGIQRHREIPFVQDTYRLGMEWLLHRSVSTTPSIIPSPAIPISSPSTFIIPPSSTRASSLKSSKSTKARRSATSANKSSSGGSSSGAVEPCLDFPLVGVAPMYKENSNGFAYDFAEQLQAVAGCTKNETFRLQSAFRYWRPEGPKELVMQKLVTKTLGWTVCDSPLSQYVDGFSFLVGHEKDHGGSSSSDPLVANSSSSATSNSTGNANVERSSGPSSPKSSNKSGGPSDPPHEIFVLK